MKVYNKHGIAQRNGAGTFPRELMNRFPLLPLEEEGRLNDMPLRENFIERVFAYYRWTEMLDNEATPGGLVKFHTAHKLTLMDHSPKDDKEPWRLVRYHFSGASSSPSAPLWAQPADWTLATNSKPRYNV